MNPHDWRVMLADTARADDETLTDLASKGYTFDVKWDGVRGLAIVENGRLTLRNRKGEDFTYRYPEIAEAFAERFAGVDCVLDGEVLIFDPQTGVPRFTLTSRRSFGPGRTHDIARMAKALPATFCAFDALAFQGIDIRDQPQHARLGALGSILLGKQGSRIHQSITDPDGVALMEAVKKMQGEGLIAKKLTAPYRAGRRSDWVKIKPTHTITCLVTGWEPGEGWRSDTFGALTIAVLDGERIVDVGKVGSGFRIADLELLDPFVKNGHGVLVEVEYQERQPDTGVLRFPRFKGVRWDVDREAASITQFDPAGQISAAGPQ